MAAVSGNKANLRNCQSTSEDILR